MPAVRQATAVLEAKGSFGRHPERARKRAREPRGARGIGPAPAHMSDVERAIWDEIIENAHPGVWDSSHRMFLEGLCVQIARFRADRTSFGTKSMMVLLTQLRQAGMTPADRSRVVALPDEVPDEEAKTGLAAYL